MQHICKNNYFNSIILCSEFSKTYTEMFKNTQSKWSLNL